MYTIPNFNELYQLIVQEIRNQTGLTIPADSDAAIRAQGTAAVAEGLYQHQNYIQRQLFVQTADEPYLYLHAENAGTPRMTGNRASGQIIVESNNTVVFAAGSKVTDQKGHFWSVSNDTTVLAGTRKTVDVVADQVGSAWNFDGETLVVVSPPAGMSGVAEVVSIAGGDDLEDLENWRLRILGQIQQGPSRDRSADIERSLQAVPGVGKVYVYPKRRGLGSLDVAVTAVGQPPTLPNAALLQAVQAVLDAEAGFWADVRAYAPTQQLLNVTANVVGTASSGAVEQVIRDYIAELGPADPYFESILNARIISLNNVTHVTLTPASNVYPTVDWMHTHWLRAGTITVNMQ